jgi:hypothetical protein
MDNLGVASEEVSDSIIIEEMRHEHLDKENWGVPRAPLVHDVRMWCTAGAETTCAPWWVVEGQTEDAASTRIAPPSLLRWLLQTQSDASGGPGAGRGVDMGSLPAWAQQVYRGTARAGRKAVRARAHRASSAAHGERRRRALDRRRSLWESRWREKGSSRQV